MCIFPEPNSVVLSGLDNFITAMRQATIIRSALLLAVVLFAGEASAQNIKLGKLRQLTAPFSGPVESYAIGYDGDTVETEEAPTLYGLKGQFIDRQGLTIEPDQSVDYAAAILTKQSFGDCIECELRESEIKTSYTTKEYSFALYNRDLIY